MNHLGKCSHCWWRGIITDIFVDTSLTFLYRLNVKLYSWMHSTTVLSPVKHVASSAAIPAPLPPDSCHYISIYCKLLEDLTPADTIQVPTATQYHEMSDIRLTECRDHQLSLPDGPDGMVHRIISFMSNVCHQFNPTNWIVEQPHQTQVLMIELHITPIFWQYFQFLWLAHLPRDFAGSPVALLAGMMEDVPLNQVQSITFVQCPNVWCFFFFLVKYMR